MCVVACIVGATEQPVEIFRLSALPKFSADAVTGGHFPSSAQEKGALADGPKNRASENEASPLLKDGDMESITLHPRMEPSSDYTTWTDELRKTFRRTTSSITQTGARIFRNLSTAKGFGIHSDSDSEASPRRNKKLQGSDLESSPTRNKASKDTEPSSIPQFMKRLVSTAGNSKYFPEAIRKRIRRKDSGGNTVGERPRKGPKPADSLHIDWEDADSGHEGYFTADEGPPSPPRFPRQPQRQDAVDMDSPTGKFPDLCFRTQQREQPYDNERPKSSVREEPLPHERPVSPKKGESSPHERPKSSVGKESAPHERPKSPVGKESFPHERPKSPKRGESPQHWRSKSPEGKQSPLHERPASPEKMTSSPRPESSERRQSPQREKPKSPPKWRFGTRPRSLARPSNREDYSRFVGGSVLGTADAMQRLMADLPVPMPTRQQTAQQDPPTTQKGDQPQTGGSSSPSRPRTPSPPRSGVSAAQLAQELCADGQCNITYATQVPPQYLASTHASSKPKQDSKP